MLLGVRTIATHDRQPAGPGIRRTLEKPVEPRCSFGPEILSRATRVHQICRGIGGRVQGAGLVHKDGQVGRITRGIEARQRIGGRRHLRFYGRGVHDGGAVGRDSGFGNVPGRLSCGCRAGRGCRVGRGSEGGRQHQAEEYSASRHPASGVSWCSRSVLNLHDAPQWNCPAAGTLPGHGRRVSSAREKIGR
ncbi:hypothetical protein CVCC1112_2107 [Paenarthrobacter nicotinovorans]|nr:hypothetical protein CVCC1112_2107 [Paenarthrobacter nicotinovorans]